MSNLAELKKTACDAIDKERAALKTVSQHIWEKPELAYQEHHAHKLLTDYLKKRAFKVTENFHLETAFKAEAGKQAKPHVGVMCEYDALPGIGHACGHNLIAEVGLAAGIGLKAVLDGPGKNLGKVTVLGCPAEEAGGGQVDLINSGAYQDMDFAMMAHPDTFTVTVLGCPAEEARGGKVDLIKAGAYQDMDIALMSHPANYSVSSSHILAMTEVLATYKGKASHAAGFPWEGVNALDAAVMAYNNVSCLRQQMKPDWRVHGIITKGGDKPNIIPEESQLYYYIRAPTEGELQLLISKVKACLDSAATATGCQVYYEWEQKPYLNMISNSVLKSLYEKNSSALGVKFCTDPLLVNAPVGSTDMGNVSHVLPSLHPHYEIHDKFVPHSPPFTEVAGQDGAHEASIVQGKALAMTALDVLSDPDLLPQIQTCFKEDLRKDLNSGD